jgi:very-short-patch-repair endonuclease
VLIDELLQRTDGVIRLRDYPRSARTIQRAAASGRVVAILPGVFVSPERHASTAIRIRAACAWSSAGSIHGLTAAQLHLRRPVTLPIRLRAPWRGEPPAWLQVSTGKVARPIEESGLRIATAAHAVVELAEADGGEAVFAALRKRLVTPIQLIEVLTEFAGSRGSRTRRTVVESAASNPWSFGEARLHDLLRHAGIGGWVANEAVRVAGRLVFPDVRFPEHSLVLEFDGEAFHSDHEQFEEDRVRQNILVLGSFRVLRFTWEAVTLHPETVIRTVRTALAMS